MQSDVGTQTGAGITSTTGRRTRRKIVFASLAALLLAGAGAWSSLARAAGPAAEERGGAMPMRRMQRILDSVGATQGQREQIRAIWSGLRPQLRAERGQHRALRQQMLAALTSPAIDAGEVERLRKLSMASTDKISALVTQGMVASAQALTPEQRKKAQEEVARSGGHRHWGGPAAE